MPTGKDYLRDIATRADHIYEKFKEAVNLLRSILEQLGGDPEEAIEPIISNYPREGKKELPTGNITIDTRRGKVTLPDGSIEDMSSSVPDQTCRSILVYANKNIDFIALDGDAIMFSSTIFASWLRVEGIAFDQIKITTTAPTSFYIVVSNTHAPSIEALAAAVNKPSWTPFHKDVLVAGTAVRLDDLDIPDGYNLVMIAKPANVGNIYFGSTAAEATDPTKHITRAKKDALSLGIANASEVWIDADNPGEGIEGFVEVD